MTTKSRLGIILLAAGLVLGALFLVLRDPNGQLRPVADAPLPIPSELDAGAVELLREDLAAAGMSRLALRTAWTHALWEVRSNRQGADPQRALAAWQALTDHDGSEELLALITPWFERPGLADPLSRQIQQLRRLAAVRPASLPLRQRDLLENPARQAEDLPAVYRARRAAALALGYGSWLDAVADDSALDAAAWSALLQDLRGATGGLYAAILGQACRRLGHPVPTPDEPLPWDVLGSQGPGSVDRVLEVRPGTAQPDPESLPRQALVFHEALDLPPWPMTGGAEGELPHAMGSVSEPTLFMLDLRGGFQLVLPESGPVDIPAVAGALVAADLNLACDHAGRPALLRGAAGRVMARALRHLYELAARSSLQAGHGPPGSEELLRQAIQGPLLAIPLWAGAGLDWLQGMDRGAIPGPMVGIRFWEAAGRMAQLGPCTGCQPNSDLPAVLFRVGYGPAAPLEDILGWAVAHQLHRYVCNRILMGDVYEADYRHDPRVTDFLTSLLGAGVGADWQVMLRQATGEGFDPSALVEYYGPLAAASAED